MHLKPIQSDRSVRFWAKVLIGFVAACPGVTAAESVRPWKATPARPYVLRGADRRLLDRAEQYAAGEQWDDAQAAITRLLAEENSSVVAIKDDRYVSLPEYCHRLLARFPAEPLARYRRLVDASSKSWYQQGFATRDEQLLQRLVDQNFCSSWGDDTLLALGELALERGDYQAARNAWLRISSNLGAVNDRLTYPDTDVSLADVQARLFLVSLREGDWQRAERELAELRESYPTASGRFGGRRVVFAEHLASLLKQSRQWPVAAVPKDWPTFAATPQRTNASAAPIPQSGYELLWSRPLANEQLSIFPIVVNDLVIYQDDSSVCAWNLRDGRAVFELQADMFQSPVMASGWLGQSAHTLTASGNRIFGITTAPLGLRRKSGGAEVLSACWGLDLLREGALAFHLPSDDPSVAFVGAPLVVENRLWVACRRNDQTARAGIACYDLDTRERLWQRWLCQANTPATGWTNELATNLLTMDAGVIYSNTNLGAIAAVQADDGRVLWLRTYERESAGLSSAGKCAYYRGPNPCVYYRGTVFALPTDSRALVALDAATGTRLWQHEVTDPTALLLGVNDEHVILANRGLQSLHPDTGELLGVTAEAKLTSFKASGIFLIATGPKELRVFRQASKTDVTTDE